MKVQIPLTNAFAFFINWSWRFFDLSCVELRALVHTGTMATVCEVLTEDTWQDEKRFKVTTGATIGRMGT